jgi:hypothetical protein
MSKLFSFHLPDNFKQPGLMLDNLNFFAVFIGDVGRLFSPTKVGPYFFPFLVSGGCERTFKISSD